MTTTAISLPGGASDSFAAPPPRRLRLAFVTDSIHMRGGQERCSAEILKRLASRHDITVVTAHLADLDPTIFHTVRHVNARRKPYLRSVIEFYFGATRAVQNDGGFDVVHANGGIMRGANLVCAHFCQFAWGECLNRYPEVREGTNLYHALMWRFTGALEKKVYRSADTQGIVAVSARTGRDLNRFYNADPLKTNVVYNGADPVQFHPRNRDAYRAEIRARYAIPENAVLLLLVGEYNRKGLATVIRAMARTKTVTPYHLLAVGRGDEAAFRAQAVALGVGDKCTFAPPTGQIEQVFGAADAFVFPTFFEPFGMVITEAMCSGIPVITTETAGAAELITHGENGSLIASPTDADALAAAIDEIVSLSDAERRERGLRGRESVVSQTWDRVAAQMEAMYLRVAEAKTR